jgi:hypothetical protein
MRPLVGGVYCGVYSIGPFRRCVRELRRFRLRLGGEGANRTDLGLSDDIEAVLLHEMQELQGGIIT